MANSGQRQSIGLAKLEPRRMGVFFDDALKEADMMVVTN